MEAEIALLQQLADGRGWRAVGEEGVEVPQIAETDHGVTAELAVVADQEHLAGIGDDAFRSAHFAVIEIEQRAVGVDAGDADDAEVGLELAEEVDGGLADDAAVAAAHHAAGDDDLEAGVLAHDAGDVQVV